LQSVSEYQHTNEGMPPILPILSRKLDAIATLFEGSQNEIPSYQAVPIRLQILEI